MDIWDKWIWFIKICETQASSRIIHQPRAHRGSHSNGLKYAGGQDDDVGQWLLSFKDLQILYICEWRRAKWHFTVPLCRELLGAYGVQAINPGSRKLKSWDRDPRNLSPTTWMKALDMTSLPHKIRVHCFKAESLHPSMWRLAHVNWTQKNNNQSFLSSSKHKKGKLSFWPHHWHRGSSGCNKPCI